MAEMTIKLSCLLHIVLQILPCIREQKLSLYVLNLKNTKGEGQVGLSARSSSQESVALSPV